MWIGMLAVVGLTAGQTTTQAQIRGCANPAGQFRVIGATESCRPQETLVLSAGPSDGVTGGADFGPVPPNGPASLSSTPTLLTTDNKATGFPRYMVWANVAVEFNSGNTANGTFASPTSANCAITYTVAGRTGKFRADGRSVAYPAATLGNNQIVRLNIGLNGTTGFDLTPALTPSDVVDFTLECSSNAGPNPPSNQVPVKVTGYSLTGIGINKTFGQ
jgi:hypothetical protein